MASFNDSPGTWYGTRRCRVVGVGRRGAQCGQDGDDGCECGSHAPIVLRGSDSLSTVFEPVGNSAQAPVRSRYAAELAAAFSDQHTQRGDLRFV
jgi:hypothetical protein